MANFRLRRFAAPTILRRVAPPHLLAFLQPYRDFLTARGWFWPANTVLDYDGLVRIFLSPDAATPRALIDALYLVNELADDDGMDKLVLEAQRLELTLAADPTPADVAVQVWCLAPDILVRLHAEHLVGRMRSYESYQAEQVPPAFTRPDAAQLRVLEAALDAWFLEKHRGRGTRVLMSDRGDTVWFLVGHGETLKREESLEGGARSSVCYRPLRHDVLVYHPSIGELHIHAQKPAEKLLYREQFGQVFFGDPAFFPGIDKYTLDPLRATGAASLHCADVAGIEWVKLHEVQLYRGGTPWELLTHKSDDVFAVFEARRQAFPAAGRLVKATFEFKFNDQRKPRKVVIRPSNIAHYTRDDDGVLVEAWLRARGFAAGPAEAGGGGGAEVLGVA